MTPGKLPLIGYFVLVFVGGGVVGALSQRLYTASTVNAKAGRRGSPEEYRKRYVEEMRTRLKLDDNQLQNLNQILSDTESKFRAARERMEPEMKVIREEQVGRINSMLNDAQKREYQKMRDERAQRMKKNPPPRSGAPGGC